MSEQEIELHHVEDLVDKLTNVRHDHYYDSSYDEVYQLQVDEISEWIERNLHIKVNSPDK